MQSVQTSDYGALVDASCSACGREPSHPQVRRRFILAAYYRIDLARVTGQRCYIATLCEACYEADRRGRTNAARNRFFRQVSRWSGLTGNQHHIVRLLENPGGVTGEEWEAENCFQDGVAAPCKTLLASEGKR